jgi:glycosyltransferase involved in cell wall biosynthesis/2-polyprenyl-3-methyl-5-hydroxy-6-metoxy-1,4-benzoquinol methylase
MEIYFEIVPSYVACIRDIENLYLRISNEFFCTPKEVTAVCYLKKISEENMENLEDNGERVDINLCQQVNFNEFNIYQKSHFRRYQYTKSLITTGSINGDFSCGTGYGSVMIASNSSVVIGIDINDRVINAIKERYNHISNVQFLCLDLLCLDYNSQFDNIVSFETIEHLAEDEISLLFHKFAQALKPGGKLIFSTPYMQPRSMAAIAMGFHQTFNINEETIKKWLASSDLSLKSIKYQNYDTHEIEDDLKNKDFIICVAQKGTKNKSKVSICIPAYNQPELLQRCLESVVNQTYKNYEVIITDDSDNELVADVVNKFSQYAIIKYFRNKTRLGQPGNWNEAIKYSTGDYIKILHHDDWFFNESSLSTFVTMLDENPQASIGICPSRHYNSEMQNISDHIPSDDELENIGKDPNLLLVGNIIGSPSATIYRRTIENIFFDEKLKWCVDIDFYIKTLKSDKNLVYSNQNSICIDATNPNRVTFECHNCKEIELFEHFYLFDKYSMNISSSKFVDLFTQLFKRYHVKSLQEIYDAGYTGKLDNTFDFILAEVNKTDE